MTENNAAQPGLTDDQIEALAKKHIAPHADRLEAIMTNPVPYQQTEQFRRVKAMIGDVLSKLRAEGVQAGDERPSFNPEDCNKEVYERGTFVGLFDIPKNVANELCAGISSATGARVDWHYFGGRVRVMALPAAPSTLASEAVRELPEAQQHELIGGYFAEDWAKEAAAGLLHHHACALAALASAPVAEGASVVWKHTHRISGVIELSLEDLEGNSFNRERWESMPHYAAPQASEAVRILFPAHLRKMWSGGEVQAWLDEHQGITPPKPSAKGSLERYRKWQAEQTQADKDGGDCAKGAGKWPMLSELHLHALMFAYNEGYSKAYDGRVFPNPFSENGSQAAAWQLGTDDGTEARAALAAQPSGNPGELSAQPGAQKSHEPLPTETMVVVGFEAVSCFQDTDAYKAMTGCQQAAESARVCWAAMVEAMPEGSRPSQDAPPTDEALLGLWAEALWPIGDICESKETVLRFARQTLARFGASKPHPKQHNDGGSVHD